MATEPPASAQPNVSPYWWRTGMSGRFWALVVVEGIVAGVVATALEKLLRLVQHLAWTYRTGEFIVGVQRHGASWRVAVLAAAGLLAGVGWWALVKIAGTRGGDLSDAIWSTEARIPLVPTLVTATLSETVIALGASLGREAPPKEASAAIASRLALWAGLSVEERRLLVACAAGAGFAGIYNIPLGGAIFAVEVLMGSLALPLVLPALAASTLATAVTWIVLPIHPYYQAIPSYPAATPLLVWALLAGPVIGVASTGYVWVIGWAQRHKLSGRNVLWGPLVVFGLLGVLAVRYPQLLGNGKDVAEQAFLGGDGILVLATLFVLKPLVTAACLGSGATGGLFTPTTSYGALLGAGLGHLWGLAWPGAAVGSYALVGATAMLGAALNGPVSGLVLMVELTHHMTSLLVPAMLALVGANLVSRMLHSRSVYSVRLPHSEPPDRWSRSGVWAGDGGR